MNLVNLLQELQQRNVVLSSKDDALKVEAPKGARQRRVA